MIRLMNSRSRVWWVMAVLFTLGNAAGVVVAAAAGEAMHAGVHAAFLLPGVYLVWRLAPRRVGNH